MRALSANQSAAVEKLKRLKVGALFLSAGCGKTQTAVSLINTVDGVDLLLWVCPLQTKKNLQEELAKCGCRYPAEIVGVESIGQSDRVFMETLNRIQAAKRAFLIVDESIKIKNMEAKRTQRLMVIGSHAEYKLILNGTPITKNIVDIYAQMQFLSPKIMRNMSFYQFREDYCHYKQWKKNGRIQKTVITGFDNIDHLLSIIDPYIFQCSLDLGLSKHYRTLNWYMTECEREAYQELKYDLFEKHFKDDERDKVKDGAILAILSELQHSYCCCEEKFDVIEGLLDDRTMIYCKYIRSKEELQRRFPGVKVMTYGTGSLGLNLQQYSRIIYFDKTFDYAFREQSEARIYRTGQQNDCEYFDLTGNVGLESMIDMCIKRKTSLVESFKLGYKKDLTEQKKQDFLRKL